MRRNAFWRRTLAWALSASMGLSMLSGLPALAAAPSDTASQITIALADSDSAGKSAVTVNWVLSPEAGDHSSIEYSAQEDLAHAVTVPGVMNAVDPEGYQPENKQDNVKAIHSFHAMLNNLTPGTEYYYRIDGGEVQSFTAPMAEGDDFPFSFVVSADTQGETPEQFENTKELYDYIKDEEGDAQFLIHTGDVVEDASYSDYWQYFFDAAQDLLCEMPVLATPGNHDSGSYDTQLEQFRSRFDYSQLTHPDGLSEAAQGTVYSFEYGDALFVCLNSYADGRDAEIQDQFLQDQCHSTDKMWKIVFYHEATYDPGASHYQLDNETGKQMTDAGVDLVLNGHEHAYARTTIQTTSDQAGTDSIRTDLNPGQAPTYVIGGSVYNYAYSLSNSDTSWNDVFYDLRVDQKGTGGGAIYSPGVYGKVDVTSNSLTYTAYYKATGEENDFRVIDTFTIQKSGDEITQTTGGGTQPESVTYLWDNDQQDNGAYSARFNWTTGTDIQTSQLYYAKKSDFDTNGGKFTDVVLGDSSTVDLSDSLSAGGYTGGTANYQGADGAEYCYAPVQSHKAETGPLEPNTEYVYCVGDGGANTTSVQQPAVIKTPAADTNSFEFIYFTDAQQGACGSYESTLDAYGDFGDMLEGAVTEYPDAAFLLSGGDQVNYTFDTWEWDAFFDQGKNIFSRYPLYLSTGNHEYEGAGNEWCGGSWSTPDVSVSSLAGRYNPPENGVAYYGGGDGTQRMVTGTEKLESMAGNYYFIYGDTLFLVLDYQDSTQEGLTKAQQEWVKSVVKQNPTKWRVAVMHKSLFGYRIDDPTKGDYGNWSDTFDAAGIDLVLMGHDHVYTRTKYYTNRGNADAQTPGSGTTYITGASANNDNRSDYYEDSPYVLVHSTTDFGRSYLTISVSPEALKVSVHGLEDGQPKTVEDDVVITTVPRTYDLSDWTYPEVPEEDDDLSLTGVTVSGIAKEGQTLRAALTPSSAAASFLWQRSSDKSVWTQIDGAESSSYTVQAADVGQYLRCVASGTGFYHGTVESEPTGKVTSLAGGGQVVQLSSTADLEAMAEGFGSDAYPIDASYELTGDLDMTGVTISPIGGQEETPLLGTFNGKGFAIRNLTIAGAEDHSAGLFAYVGNTGHVANVVLDRVTVTGSGENTGAIAGASEGLIENCSVTGAVSGHSYTGGMVGRLHGGTLQNCLADASVTGSNGGGLIGGTNYGGPITEKNVTTGNVIRNNLVLGAVTGTSYTGGFVGDMGGSSGAILQTCTGNAVNNTVDADTDNCIAGYWSGSRPIVDEDQLNYAVDTLSTEGMSQGTEAFESKTAGDFATQALYQALGWDFDQVWSWDREQSHPVPQVVDVTSGDDLVTIIATAGGGGTIQPEGYTLVQRGEDQTFTFAPNEYYEIDTVTIDGAENPAAAAAGSYTFENVTALHTIDVTFKLSDETSGQAPSLVSGSAYYNRTQDKHIDLTVDFGQGGLGIPQEDWRSAVESVRILKDGQPVLDCGGCFWFPSTGYGYPENILQICYDDMEKLPDYNQLIPGVYDLEVTFRDVAATVCTIPLTVVEQPVHTLAVEGGVISADGVEAGADSGAVAEQTAVTVAAVVPQGQRFSSWEVTGLEGVDVNADPLAFTMPAGDVTVKAVCVAVEDSTGSGTGSGGVSGSGANVSLTTSGTVSSAQMTQAVDKANAGAAITIKAAASSRVTLPVNGAADAAGNGNALNIHLRSGKILLSPQAVEELAQKASSGSLTIGVEAVTSSQQAAVAEMLNPETAVFEVSVRVNEQEVQALSGAVTLTLAVPKLSQIQDPHFLLLQADGTRTYFAPTSIQGEQITLKGLHSLACVAVIPGDQVPQALPFTDVDASAWYGQAVSYVYENGLMAGTSDASFSPNLTTSRAMIVTILWRLENTPEASGTVSFQDVDRSAWYGQAVRWAVSQGIVSGYSDTAFGPEDTITREQLAAILYRYAQYKNYDTSARTDLSGYTDASQISSWALDAVRWAGAEGLISGTGAASITPAGFASRAQTAVILMGLCETMDK